MGDPEFLGWVDASGEGVGGGWLPGKDALEPTVWRMEWPQSIRKRLITQTNPSGDLDINDLEMAGKLLAWLVLEGIVGTETLRYKNVGLFSDNTAAVSWTIRGASKKSAAAGRLLRVLALRQRVARASPLVVAHVAGELNVLGDIPSRSFGYKKAWHCKSENEFLSLINSEFPLPQKRSWRGFRLSYALSMKVISELGMTVSPMGEWRRLRRIGKSFGGTGVPIADPSELTRTWRKQTSSPRHGWQQGSQGVCERAATAVENRYKLEQCVRHSEASTRRSPWTQVINPSTNLGLTTDTSSHFNTCSKDSRTKIPRV